MAVSKQDRRNKIRKRVRKSITGTASRPRLSVFRSNKEIYAQIIDDVEGKTIAAASSRDKDISAEGDKSKQAELVGKNLAEKQGNVVRYLEEKHGVKLGEGSELEGTVENFGPSLINR